MVRWWRWGVRVQVNVPYLSIDEKMRPRHLEKGGKRGGFGGGVS